MKYVKLLLNIPNGNGGNRQSIEWNLVIETIGDLLKYADVNTEIAVNALFRAERKPDNSGYEVSHVDDHRQQQVATLLNIKIASLNEGEYLHPFNELTRVLDRKNRAILKHMQMFGSVRINEVGGYCGFQQYIDQWNAEILETVEKETYGFPIEANALTAEVLIIENQHNIDKALNERVEAITGCKPQVITMMKEKDQAWVIASITNAKSIAFESTFKDEQQLDSFMKLFLSLPKKRIIIKTYPFYKSLLLTHKLWSKNNHRHEIIFI